VPQLAAWEKVYIQPDKLSDFQATAHGKIPCENCHGGHAELRGANTETNMVYAHDGLIPEPSDPMHVDQACRVCHYSIVENSKSSMHMNLWGEKNFLAKRAGLAQFTSLPKSMDAGYNKDCFKCHTTCGDCHVTRPNAVESGFLDNHMFKKTPDRDLNCTACHGSRVGEEYLGQRSEQRDVHYIPGGMHCVDCHDMTEMHGDGTKYPHRMANQLLPKCEDCHESVSGDNTYHQTHWGELSCSVCHSQQYKSCNSCHAGEGVAEPSYLSFKIGLNPLPDDRSYTFVTVRHIPISENTFRNWGNARLQNYTALPSWKYTTPHNIRRWTTRTTVDSTEACYANCHIDGNKNREYYLLEDSLKAEFPESQYPGEIEANQPVTVDNALPAGWLN